MSPPLILAIQPDKRQASQLASIVRGMSAELLLMESTERAIAALGERLPDLILTPTLLSHRDETALAERLREFGEAAAHIQTLTIPILETAPSPSRTGVLSALRKPKRKGRLRPDERLGCTPDTFAEQISIYLNRAVEARGIHPKPRKRVPAASPAPVALTPPVEPDVPPRADRPEKGDDLPTIEELSAKTPAVPEPPVETPVETDVPPRADRPEKGDDLPTIEELSAKTPAVPEPDGSLETSTEVIAVMSPVTGAVANPSVPMPESVPRVAELPIELSSTEASTPVEEAPSVPELNGSLATSMEVIAAMTPVAGAVADHPVPMPEAIPRVAELPMELSSTEATTPADEALDVPEPDRSLDVSMTAVVAMAPDAGAGASLVPTPAVMPRVAELPMELPPAAASASEAVPVMPEPRSSLEMSMAAVAVMVPVVDGGAGASPVPMPEVMPRVAELPMELPPAAASAGHAVPVMPEPCSPPEMSMAAVAIMVPDAGSSVGGAVPMPAAIPRVADLPMQLSSVDTSMPSHDVTLAVPAPPARSIESSIDIAAAMVSGVGAATNGHPVSVPPVVARVAEVRVELPGEMPGSAHGAVPFMPTPPASSIEMSMAAVAAIVPLAAGAGHYRPAPIPAVTAPIAELPIKLPSTEPAVFADEGAVAVPEPSPRSVETSIDSLAATMRAAAADDSRLVPMPAVMHHIGELPLALPPERVPVAPAPPAALDRHTAPDANSVFVAEPRKSQRPVLGAEGESGDTTIQAATVAAQDAPPPADEPHAPAPPAVAHRISKATKKKNRLQARKEARKKGPVREDVLDNPFDPDQCQFSSLIAKLDEVLGTTEQPEPANSASKRVAKGKRRKTPTKPH